MSSTVRLSDGVRVVTLWEVPDEVPQIPFGMEVLPDTSGRPVVYTRSDVLGELNVSGRIRTEVEVATLQQWIVEGALAEACPPLFYTARDGSVTGHWRIKTQPTPKLVRKEGDSPDYLATLTLWRIP